MPYQAVLFDLDGTLVHTSPTYRYLTVGKTLRSLGVPPQGIAKSIDRFWFETNRDEVIANEFHLQPEIFWERFRQNDNPTLRQKSTAAYSDVGYLKRLRGRYKTGIVTGAPEHIATPEIALLGEQPVDAIILAIGTNGIRRKPHPDGLERCLEKLRVRPSKAIYVGNAPEDILAARNAGMLDVLIERGEYTFSDLHPTVTIKDLYQLRKVLRE